MAFCGGAERDRSSSIAYRPLRNAPRLAPLITAIGDVVHPPERRARLEGPELRADGADVLPTGNVFRPRGVDYTWNKLIVLLVTIPVLLLLVWLVQRTRQGKAMRATAQDTDAAAMMGINVNRTISFTFLIAGGAGRRRGPALRALRHATSASTRASSSA